MLNRRPPFTTLETRVTSTTVSSRFSFAASILAISLLAPLEIQARFTGPFGQRCHSPMVGIAATIKDNASDALFFGTTTDQLPHLTGYGYLTVVRYSGQCLNGSFRFAFLCRWQDCFGLTRLATFSRRSTLLRLRSAFSGWLLDLCTFSLGRCCRGCYFHRSLHRLSLLLHNRSCDGWLEVTQSLIEG